MAHIILLESQKHNLRAWEALSASEGHLTHRADSIKVAANLIVNPEISNPVLIVESEIFSEMIEGIKGLKTIRPGLAAIMVSKKPKIDEIASCVRLGVTDYRALDSSKSEIIRSLNQAVNRAASQELHISLKKQLSYYGELIVTQEEKSKDLSQSLARLIQQRDHERETLAQILHDGLSQDILALKLGLRSLSPQSEQFVPFYANLDSLSEIIRSISHRLSLRTRLTGNLKSDLALLCRQYLKTTEIELKDELGPTPIFVSEEISYSILRFFSEALDNLVKHSGASQAVIGYNHDREEFHLSDNGRGWDTNQGEKVTQDGLGLLVMREYARGLDAKFEITGSPESGTRIALRLNLGSSTDRQALGDE